MLFRSEATALLGYPYFFEGVVMEGNQLGRTIGFPTANLQITVEDKLIPANGVYVVQVRLLNENRIATGDHTGMMNIGVRPTVDGKSRVIEVHIFQFSETIYQQLIQVRLLHFLREEIRFPNFEALQHQLRTDKQDALNWLEHNFHR